MSPSDHQLPLLPPPELDDEEKRLDELELWWLSVSTESLCVVTR